MHQIKVLDETKTREFEKKNGSGKVKIMAQRALVRLGHEVRAFWLELPRDAVPFVPGEYLYRPSFRVNQYGDLELDSRGYALEKAPEKASK